MIMPIVVSRVGNRYMIIAGERRYRASRLAGRKTIPAVVKKYSEREIREVSLIENLQREDLNAVETAQGYRRLMDKYGMTQEQLSAAVGKSRPAIANTLRILTLPEDILPMVAEGKLSAGHAKAVLSAPEERRTALAKRIAAEGLSVREAERLAAKREEPGEKKPAKKESFPKDKYYREMQVAITNELGRPVKITENKNGGVIELPFYSKQELAAICERLADMKK